VTLLTTSRPRGALAALVLVAASAAAEDRPTSGTRVPGYDPVDQAVLKFMDQVDATAATVAVSRDGRTVYSRGFGWRDQDKKVPVPADALMRIGSATKPITRATVLAAVRGKRLGLDTKAFDLIGAKRPDGKDLDPDLRQITVGHLLDHKGGWDREATFDPVFRPDEIAKELGLTGPPGPADVIAYMLSRPLQFPPGTKEAYSNFGYVVLGRVLEAAAKKPYGEYVEHTIFKPLGVKDVKPGRTAVADRDPREVWYPVPKDIDFSLEVMDSAGGLIASAPALARFMRTYWLTGEPRKASEREDWTVFGSLPGTTVLARQRLDGTDVAVLLNNRREKEYHADNKALEKAIDEAIDATRKKK
jgi:CubicO group peptidase (beta-lactamase class C family)